MQGTLDRSQDTFRDVIAVFRNAPHFRAGQADQSGMFSALFEFLEEYRNDAGQDKGAGDVAFDELLEHVQLAMGTWNGPVQF